MTVTEDRVHGLAHPTARDLRVHLFVDHRLATRGRTYVELLAMHHGAHHEQLEL